MMMALPQIDPESPQQAGALRDDLPSLGSLGGQKHSDDISLGCPTARPRNRLPKTPCVDGKQDRVQKPNGSKPESEPVDNKGDIAGQRDCAQPNDLLHAESNDNKTRGQIAGCIPKSHGAAEVTDGGLAKLYDCAEHMVAFASRLLWTSYGRQT